MVVLSVIATAGGVLLTVLVTPLLNLVRCRMRFPFRSARADRPQPGRVCRWRRRRDVPCLRPGPGDAGNAPRLDVEPSRGRRQCGRRRRGLRRILVGAQVAASALLLVACLLFLRSLSHVTTLDPGFDVRHGITALVSLEENRFTPQGRHLVAEQLAERLRAVPGVTSVSFASLIPLAGDMVGLRAELRDRPDGSGVPVWTANVGPRYFETMGIGVRSGREFLSSDRVGAPPVIIVNEAFAKRAFSDGAAVGRSIRVLSERDDAWREIVAVVSDNKYGSLNEAPYPQVFLPYLQTGGQLFVQVRTTTPPGLEVAAVRSDRGVRQVAAGGCPDHRRRDERRAHVAAASHDAPRGDGCIRAAPGDDRSLWRAGVGCDAGGRRRLASAWRSARPGVPCATTSCAMRSAWSARGCTVGLAAAIIVTLPLRGFLAGVSTADPFALGGVAVVLLAVALLASAIPAHRASGVDPITALRRE